MDLLPAIPWEAIATALIGAAVLFLAPVIYVLVGR